MAVTPEMLLENLYARDRFGNDYELPHKNRLTPHAARVAKFMRNAEQPLPDKPAQPSLAIRVLRASLILEETLETLNALGVMVCVTVRGGPPVAINAPGRDKQEQPQLTYQPQPHFDLVEVVDGCADISVVTIGTLLACGVADEPVLKAVDDSNMLKFGPGGHKGPTGKWLKGPEWAPPDIRGILLELQAAA